MTQFSRTTALLLLALFIGLMHSGPAWCHDHTLHKALRKRKTRQQATAKAAAPERTCKLTIKLLDGSNQRPTAGVVRVSWSSDGKPLVLPELIKREQGWHTMRSTATMDVPRAKLRIEALRGLETARAQVEVDLTDKSQAEIKLTITRFHDAQARGWRNGNTHLHLMNLTYAEAERYLREVPASDGLDLVYLSHLRRIPDERNYISNEIVENSLPGGDLARLSQSGVLFRPGEEHRHNFGRGGEGFGHVMLLDIAKLIRPVSIGPGIMREGTDSMPLQRGIREARGDGATIVWCHNTFGFEDIPNWMAGLLDAQNIFDGGNRGSYDESFYRYLNLGMQVPFSTGTDWFIDDFSRVYVPLKEKLTSKAWLGQVAAGRTFITNGPLLEFNVDDRTIGDTVELAAAKKITIRGRAVGRADFGRIEVVHNGKVIATQKSKAAKGHYTASLDETMEITEPGWLALRTPLNEGKNQFGNPLYSHTSPIYFTMQGRRIFRPAVAEQLIAETEQGLKVIKEKAVFANEKERRAVMDVYQVGIETLRKRIAESKP